MKPYAQLQKKGYAFIESYYHKDNSLSVAKAFGVPIEPFEGRLVQKLAPRENSTPNTYSGIYGLDCFPYHTDLAHRPTPPRYLMLRCIIGYSDVPTHLVDGLSLIEAVTSDLMSRAIFRPRRPQNGYLHLLPLYERSGEDARLRWDEVFLKPASRIGEIANLEVRKWLAASDPTQITLENGGDTLLIDNWRMLHGRASIPVGREDRRIERVYLERLH